MTHRHRARHWLCSLALGSLAVLVAAAAPAAGAESDIKSPTREYYAYVCAESEDEVALVRFGPQGLELVKEIEVGTFPSEIEGPHGINVSPDGKYWYVSIAHGQPFGTIHRFSTGDDEWLADVPVGMFPATLAISPSTGLLYVVNSDFYGDHEPSTISVVETETMTEVAQIDTGTMPHGARLSRDGKALYSVNMMDDELVEIDAFRFSVRRRLSLPVEPHTDPVPEQINDVIEGSKLSSNRPIHTGSGDHVAMGHGAAAKSEPSWVTEPTMDGKIYIAGLSGHLIFEVDLSNWKVSRRLQGTGKGPYNVAVTPDAKLLVTTYKKGDAIGFFDLESGKEIAKVATTRKIPHGVAITSDGLYSFVTVEGVGGEPGVVEVFDNRVQQRVATIDVGKQAGGVAIWER